MKIALIGYGKMGKAIESYAVQRGHEVVVKIDSRTLLKNTDLSQCEIAIEFTRPELAVDHMLHCISIGIPVVVGTTAWKERLSEVETAVLEQKGSVLYASNFSIGVNLFFTINKELARLMAPYKEYKASIEETHHTQKIDAPSGTAVTIAEGILEENKNYTKWELTNDTNAIDQQDLAITANREDSVPGTHIVKYTSDIDTISFEHVAHNRDGFALGAVIAAEWLGNKKGLFTMHDVLKINL